MTDGKKLKKIYKKMLKRAEEEGDERTVNILNYLLSLPDEILSYLARRKKIKEYERELLK